MTVSLITTVMQEGFATSLSMFDVSGVAYLLWTAPTRTESTRQLCWRPHDGAPGTQVIADVVGPFGAHVGRMRTDGLLLVVFDDETGREAKMDSQLWWAAFDFVSGAVVEGPEVIGPGAKPSLTPLTGVTPVRLALTFREGRAQAIRVRESLDEGRTWHQPQPVLNNKVRMTTQVATAGFDGTHVLAGQVGSDARRLVETGVLTRTRPLAALAHASEPGVIYAVESSQRVNAGIAQLNDNLAGRFAALADAVLLPTRQRVGADDGVGELLRVDVLGAAPVILDSHTLGGEPGTDVARVAGSTTYLAGILGDTSAAVVGITTSPTFGYAYGYSDQNATAGGLAAFELSTASPFAVLTDVPVYAAACAEGLLVAATNEDGGYTLRFYVEGTSPTLQSTHRMPARVRHLCLRMSNAMQGEVVVAMDGRLDVYRFTTLAGPLQRVGGWPLRSQARCQAVALTPRGNIVAALGEAGVAVFSPTGDQLAGLELSGPAPAVWEPGRTYALGELVQPRPSAPYAAQRRYFRCTSAGTSGQVEPAWGPQGATTDNTTAWVEAGRTTAFVADILVDSERRRIYAVGVIGGAAATEGRIYILSADALV